MIFRLFSGDFENFFDIDDIKIFFVAIVMIGWMILLSINNSVAITVIDIFVLMLVFIFSYIHYKMIFIVEDEFYLKVAIVSLASFFLSFLIFSSNLSSLLVLFLAIEVLQILFLTISFAEDLEFEFSFFVDTKKESLKNLKKNFGEIKGFLGMILISGWMLFTIIDYFIFLESGINLLVSVIICTSISYEILVKGRSKFYSKVAIVTGLSFIPMLLIFYNDYNLLLAIFLAIGVTQVLSLFAHFEKEVSTFLSKKWKFF